VTLSAPRPKSGALLQRHDIGPPHSDGQGLQRTGANIQATPRQSLTHVPRTASGSETDLKGKISFPAIAEISPGTARAFEVRTP